MKNSTLSLTETIHGSDPITHQTNIHSAGTVKSSPIRNIVLLVIYLAALFYILDCFA